MKHFEDRGSLGVKLLIIGVVALVLILVLGWFATEHLGNYARDEVIRESRAAVTALGELLQGELGQVNEATMLLATSKQVISAFNDQSREHMDEAHVVLDRYNQLLHMSVCYLLDNNGTTIATSNRDQPDSFLGKNYKFRPYFTQAKAGKRAHYFALGITSKKKGYYAAAPVKNTAGEIIGIAVVKKELDRIAKDFTQFENGFLVDPHGVVFIASVPLFDLRALWPINEAARGELLESRQFGDGPFYAVFPKELSDNEEIDFEERRVLVTRHVVDDEGWSIVILHSVQQIFLYRLVAIMTTLFLSLVILACMGIIYFVERSNRKVHQNQARLEHIALSSRDWIWEVNKKGQYTYSNQAVKDLLGYEPDEVIGKYFYDFFAPDDKEELIAASQKTFADRKTFHRSINKNITKDGRIVMHETTGMPVFDQRGNLVGYCGIDRDVTERVAAEERIKQARDYAQLIFSVTPSAIFTVDRECTVTDWNKKAEEITGFSADEIIGKKCSLFAEDPCKVKCGMYAEDVVKPVVAKECTIRTKDGQIKIVSKNSDLLRDEHGAIIGGIESFEDITERTKAEVQIKKLSRAVEQSPAVVVITDTDGTIEYVNPKFCELTGYTFEEAVGENPRVLKSGDQPDEFYKELWDTITAGREWYGDFCNKKKNGELYWESASISPIRDVHGTITHFLAVKENVTERKKAEEALQEAKDDLEKKNKELQKLDQLKTDFVSTVSHELRTPIAITTEGISLVLDGIAGPVTEKQKNLLKTSKNNIDRLTKIINDLLDMSKIEAGRLDLHYVFVDFRELIDELARSYETVTKARKLLLHTELPDEKIYLYIDGDKMIQVITNLLNNATKFTPENGSITISVAVRSSDILVSVKDTGVGVAPDDLKKMFDKFSQFGRTAGAGAKGTGLGLSIAKALVEMHNGRIWVESEVDKGTTFFVSLPNYEKARVHFGEVFDGILREAHTTAFVLIDVSNHHDIVQQHGENVLINIMNTLVSRTGQEASRPEDTVFLYDVHSIFVVLPGMDRVAAGDIVSRIKQAIAEEQFEHNDTAISIKTKFGVSVFPDDVQTREGLVRVASENITRTKTVLVVDDHPEIVDILSARLKEAGYQVTQAHNGKECLESIAKHIPDLIVLDIMMPEMNGYEVYGRLKEDPKTAHIPVILLSAHDVDTEKIESAGFGMIPVIEKTSGFEHVVDIVDGLL